MHAGVSVKQVERYQHLITIPSSGNCTENFRHQQDNAVFTGIVDHQTEYLYSVSGHLLWKGTVFSQLLFRYNPENSMLTRPRYCSCLEKIRSSEFHYLFCNYFNYSLNKEHFCLLL